MSEPRKSPRQKALNASEAKKIWDACTHVCDDVDVQKWINRKGNYRNFSEVRALPQAVTSDLLWHQNVGTTWFHQGHRFILPTWEIDGSFAGIAARQVYNRLQRKDRTSLWVTTEFNQHPMMFLADSVARACMATPIGKHAKHCTVNVVFLHTDYLKLLGSGATCVVMALAKAWTKDMVARFGERVYFKLHDNDEPKWREKTLALIKSFEDAFRSIATNSMSMRKEPRFGWSESQSKSQRDLPWSAPPDLLDDDPPDLFDEPDDDLPPPLPTPARTDIPTLVAELLRASTASDDESRARMDRLRYAPRSRFQFTTNVGERLDRYLAEHQVPKSQGRDAWLALNDLLDKVLPP